MGYLNERLQRLDGFLAMCDTPPELREAARTCFFIGAHAQFDAIVTACRLKNEDERNAFMNQCREEIVEAKRDARECLHEMFGIRT
ncbi:hypothetical protein [Paraburkholderia adhaesiva]|uniref:hypothetical protein n=1 Tax=Paraburkholderia adhaesiva TaxID=2883244 RepID=UPI001F3F2ADC|nr:hypothetical protein [Paraburkholderia adhaesiva]